VIYTEWLDVCSRCDLVVFHPYRPLTKSGPEAPINTAPALMVCCL
jgi:hypothetical protein